MARAPPSTSRLWSRWRAPVIFVVVVLMTVLQIVAALPTTCLSLWQPDRFQHMCHVSTSRGPGHSLCGKRTTYGGLRVTGPNVVLLTGLGCASVGRRVHPHVSPGVSRPAAAGHGNSVRTLSPASWQPSPSTSKRTHVAATPRKDAPGDQGEDYVGIHWDTLGRRVPAVYMSATEHFHMPCYDL